MIAQPTYKVCRRLGAGVYDKCQTQKFVLSEAKHAKNQKRGKRGTVTDFARQLLEKQKIRFAYGIHERQLRRYVEEAQRVGQLGSDPTVRLLEQLELRLDNVVYRSGLAASRRAARQMVSHGHIAVKGRRVTVPSFMLSVGDTFEVRERTKQKPIMELAKQSVESVSVPVWFTFDTKQLAGKVLAKPNPETVEMVGSVGAILEYYSR